MTVQQVLFELVGQRADRIDERTDGTVAIIDYKTGAVPSTKEVSAGYAPQLPLEAVIAAAGGFDVIGAKAVSELAYWRLTGPWRRAGNLTLPVTTLTSCGRTPSPACFS